MLNPPARWRWFKVDDSNTGGTGTGESKTEEVPTPKETKETKNGAHEKYWPDAAADLDRRLTIVEGKAGSSTTIINEATGWTKQTIAALVMAGFSFLVIVLSLIAYALKRPE